MRFGPASAASEVTAIVGSAGRNLRWHVAHSTSGWPARVKDASLSVALATLNPKDNYRESRSEAPPARSSGLPAAQQWNGAFNAPQAEIRAIED